jgi:PRTRC genetic system protein B
MKAQVNLHDQVTLKLQEALMIYGDERTQGRSYITHHKVENGQLGPAKPLTAKFIESLAQSAGQTIALEILPENVLVRTADTIVWWTPPQLRPMFFTGTREVEVAHLNGKTYPHPPLVWMATDGQLYVRALLDNERPGAGTHLYVAPYWNVSDAGLICLGSMMRPDTHSTAAIKQWEDSFFASQFTHPNATKLVEWAGGYEDFMTFNALGKLFPSLHLIQTNHTLGQFIQRSR